MDIVEKEAEEYCRFEFFNGELIPNVENLSSDLSSKLYSYRRKQDKLSFLNVLRKGVLNQKLEHEKSCSTLNCQETQEKEIGLFVIDQEIEEIS